MIRLGIEEISYLGNGGPLPHEGLTPLRQLPLLILVGMTGAGKTTMVQELSRRGMGFGLIPERRELADAIVIPAVLAEEPGTPPPADRIARLALTRRFRERNPGGFAHLLANLAVVVPPGVSWFLFDGLRGPDEVNHALAQLPRAGLAVLDLSDGERLRRLLVRQDGFDRLAPKEGGQRAGRGRHSEEDLFGEGTVFTPAERKALLEAIPPGEYPAGEVREKIRIIAEERKNYRMTEVAAIAGACPEGRMLHINLPGLNPEAVAGMISAWWPPLQVQGD